MDMPITWNRPVFYARCRPAARTPRRIVMNHDLNHTPIEQTAAWQQLQEHAREMRATHLRELFVDQARGATFTRQAAGLTLDLSKQRWTDTTRDLLLDLA